MIGHPGARSKPEIRPRICVHRTRRMPPLWSTGPRRARQPRAVRHRQDSGWGPDRRGKAL